MVMFGGTDGSNSRNDVWTLNLTSYDWAEVTSATKPSARNSHSSIIYDGQMVIFGGSDASSKKNKLKLI